MTKKLFKELCNFQVFTGVSKRVNAIYYDWKSEPNGETYIVGYKYMAYADVKNCSKADLFKAFHNWVIKEQPLPWYINYKYAATDPERFKVPLSIR
jgi:hypothetical protein